jgi:hypothetical protein
MDYFINGAQYFELFTRFHAKTISATEFERLFSQQWELERDKNCEIEKEWNHRHDLDLIHEVKKGKISHVEFHRRWNKLYGITEEIDKLGSIIDRTYTCCNCFWPDIPAEEVNPPLVLDEKLFREEILGLYEELKRWFEFYGEVQKMNQAEQQPEGGGSPAY